MSNITDADGDLPSCLSITSILLKRRLFDLPSSLIGCILSSIHLGVLLYIRFVRNGKGFALLLSQSIVSLVTLFWLAAGCLFDLCAIRPSPFFIAFRAYVWLFLVNACLSTYGFLIVALCFDRYIALNKPVFYSRTFVHWRMRMALIVVSCVLGAICNLKWLLYNTMISNGTDYEQNIAVTSTWWFTVWRALSTIAQYFVTGIAMIVLAVRNVRKLRALNRAHQGSRLRMCGKAQEMWTNSHQTIAKICVILATSFVVINWTYAAIDWFYTDELNETSIAYGIAQLLINLFQVCYIQLNLFFFSACSQLYRNTLIYLITFPFRRITRWYWSRGAAPITSTTSICSELTTSSSIRSTSTFTI